METNEKNDQPTAKKTIVKKTKAKTTKKKAPAQKKVTSKKSPKKTPHKKKGTKESPFQSFSKKSTKIFDTLLDEVKEIPKKTSELTKNSHIIESISKLISKTKDDFIQNKRKYTELHKLNSQISSNKRKQVQKISLLGKKTFDLLEKSNISAPELKALHEEMVTLKKELKDMECQRKKLLDKK
ncbi:hypothetical protein BVX93_01460 [bacterium B13(2017)]|nr:hypothetical protein BVX93_01460 [bacterium B13(2017)]